MPDEWYHYRAGRRGYFVRLYIQKAPLLPRPNLSPALAGSSVFGYTHSDPQHRREDERSWPLDMATRGGLHGEEFPSREAAVIFGFAASAKKTGQHRLLQRRDAHAGRWSSRLGRHTQPLV